MPLTFKDADKKAGDLLKKGFVNGQKFTTKIKTATGVTFTTESVKKKHDQSSFASKIGAKFNDKGKGFRLNKFEIDSAGKNGPKCTIEASMDLDEPSVPGARFSLKAVIANAQDWESEMAEIGAEYTAGSYLFNGKIDPVNKTGSFNVTSRFEGFLGGFEGTAKYLGDKATKNIGQSLGLAVNHSFFLGYEAKDFSIVARSTAPACKVSVFHQYSSAMSLGTVATINYDKLCGNENPVNLAAAGKYAFDRDTSMAVSVSDKANLKLGYSQKIFPNLKFTGSASVDMKASSGKVSAPLGCGFQFDFGDI